MTDQTFQHAYARVRSRYAAKDWLALSPRQITDAIYREIREIDAERHDRAVMAATESLAAQ